MLIGFLNNYFKFANIDIFIICLFSNNSKKNIMKNANKFNEIRKNIHLYLDQALNDEDQVRLMAEVKNNPDYPQMINSERNFRTLLKNKVKRSNVSTDLIQAIVDKVKLG